MVLSTRPATERNPCFQINGYSCERRRFEMLLLHLLRKVADCDYPVAHGSFYDPNCPDNEPPRESIELRVLVVY